MSDWLEHSVQIEVPAPIDLVWNLWSDLEKMPQWMKWIESVEVKFTNERSSKKFVKLTEKQYKIDSSHESV